MKNYYLPYQKTKDVAATKLQSPLEWALRKLRMERRCPPAVSSLQCTLAVHLEEAQDEKAEEPGPRLLRCMSKEWVTRMGQSPSYTQKSTKSLNLRYLVFFNNNLLLFWLPGLCCRNSYTSWVPLCLFGVISQSDLRCYVRSLSPQFCQVFDNNFQLLNCTFFFFSVDRFQAQKGIIWICTLGNSSRQQCRANWTTSPTISG